MDQYQLVARNFQQAMEAISLSVDILAEPVQQSAVLLSSALLSDHKLFACGNGAGAVVAQLFSTYMANRYERERPGLPVLNLSADGAILSAIGSEHNPAEVFSRQIRALGAPGDAMLAVDGPPNNLNLLRAVQAAHERDIKVVALCSDEQSALAALLEPGDSSLVVAATTPARIIELQVMVIGCLCELIDSNLFGNHYAE
jgi:D-sedoheptulose 7-phosphate isomerase